MHQLFLLIGGNLNNRRVLIARAGKLLNDEVGNILKSSGIYETEAWEFHSDNLFLNQVILIETKFSAHSVLERIQFIEKKLGKKEKTTNGYESRIIDIDILFYDNQEIDTENLTIPHPMLHLRKFVLEPLNEIAPTLNHPKFQLTITQLLNNCKDYHKVELSIK